MKKWITIALALALCAGAVSLSGGQDAALQADASVIKSLEMVDNFDGEVLNADAWTTTNGVKQSVDYSAVRVEGNDLWGSYVVFQKMALDESWDSFTIEMELNWVGAASWTGFFFGAANSRDFYYTSPSSYFLQIRDAGMTSAGEPEGMGIRLCPRNPSSGVGFYGAYDQPEKTEFRLCDVFQEGDLLSGGAVQSVVMEFSKIQGDPDNAFSMTFKWRDLDGGQEYRECSFTRMEIGGYMGFKTMGATTLEIRNFTLSTGLGSEKEELYSTDFSNGSISYPSLPDSTTDWCATPNAGIEEYVYCGKFCTVSFNGVKNGSLVYTDPIRRSADSLKNFEISYDVSLSGLTQDTYLGSGFALEQPASDPAEKSFIGIRKDGNGYAIAQIAAGEVVSEQSAGSVVGLTATIKFVGYYDGTVRVYLNNTERAAFEDVAFDGYTSVSAVAFSSDASAPSEGCSIDNFIFYTYRSLVSAAEDVGIDFKGVREYELAGVMVDEHYVNSRKWIMYGGVKTPMQTSRNYVMFHDISGDAAFLSKEMFGDQIVRFDFKPSSVPEGEQLAGFGYSFGRELLDSSYTEAPGVYFRKEGASTLVYGMNMSTESGSSQTTCPVNIYEDTDTWYTCLIIVSARTVKVFIKETAAPDSAFGEPVITFTDVDVYGYTAWMIENSTGKKAYYYATNLSVVNIDPMLMGVDENV